MKNFEGIMATKTGVPVKDVKFNYAVNLWLGFVWDKRSFNPDNKWTTCAWTKSGKCGNRNRPELDLSMTTIKTEHDAEKPLKL